MHTPALDSCREQIVRHTSPAAPKPARNAEKIIQRALNLYSWSLPHRDTLERTGLDLALLDALVLRAQACQEAQTLWHIVKKRPAPSLLAIRPLERQARELQAELRAGLQYLAQRQGKRPRAYLPDAPRRNTRNLRLAHFRAHAQSAHKRRDELIAVGIDPACIDAAMGLRDKLDAANSALDLDMTHKEAYTLRNRAFAFLEQAARAIRQTGRFAFRNDPLTLRGFTY
jgi:hypothetical protein